MDSHLLQRAFAVSALTLASAVVACKKPPGQGRFTGTAVLAGESQGSSPNEVAEVTGDRLTFGAGSRLAGCVIQVNGGPDEPRRTMGALPNRCRFAVGDATIEATASGAFEASGNNLVLTLHIADIDPSTGNTGYRAWTYTFTGQR